jgi:type I restriction enzyme S subunit
MPTTTTTTKQGWQKLKLGEVCAINMGQSPKSIFYNEKEIGLPFLQGVTEFGDMYPKIKQYTSKSTKIAQNGDILFSVRAPVGDVNYAPFECCIGRGLCGIKSIKEKSNQKYIYYYLKQNKQEFINSSNGAIYDSINKDTLLNFPILIPSLSKQKKIAEVLGAYDDLIEVNQKKIKILEELAQSIYKEWFVKPIQNGIPDGWEIMNLEQVADVIKGRSYKSSEIGESGDYFFVNLKCFNRNGGFRHDGIKMYSGKIKENQYLQTGDIVIAVTDMTQKREIVARPAQLPILKNKKVTFSCDVVKIEPQKNNIVDKNYLYYSLRFSDFSNITKNKANGVNVLHLSTKDIEKWDLVIPTKEIQNKFETIIKSITNDVNVIVQENDNLQKTRDLLIPQLVGGRVSLK